MHIQRINTADELQPLREEWNALSGGVPFRSWEWMEAWWRHHQDVCSAGGSPGQLFTLAVYDDDGQLIGLAPWYLAQTSRRGCVIRFLGSGRVCTDYQTILTAPGQTDVVARGLVAWLTGSEQTPGHDAGTDEASRWNLLELEGADVDDVSLNRFLFRAESAGCLVHREVAESCWRIELPERWEDLLLRFSKGHRKQIRRAERRMLDTDRAVLHLVERREDLGRGLDILFDLHRRRRESLGDPGAFADERFTAFHREVAARLLENGSLRLYWLELDGRPIAAEYQLAGNGGIYVYQGGVLPDASHFGPGNLILIATLRRAIEEGCQWFDFLRGDEPYKQHWRATPIPGVVLRVVPDRTIARACHQVWIAGKNVKRWLKSTPDVALGHSQPAGGG